MVTRGCITETDLLTGTLVPGRYLNDVRSNVRLHRFLHIDHVGIRASTSHRQTDARDVDIFPRPGYLIRVADVSGYRHVDRRSIPCDSGMAGIRSRRQHCRRWFLGSMAQPGLAPWA